MIIISIAEFTLAYVVYPEAVSRLPAAPVWSILFFFMLFLLAIDSQFLMVQSIIIAIMDEWEHKLSKHKKKVIFTVCFLIYVLGLPLVSQVKFYCLSSPRIYSLFLGPRLALGVISIWYGNIYGNINLN